VAVPKYWLEVLDVNDDDDENGIFHCNFKLHQRNIVILFIKMHVNKFINLENKKTTQLLTVFTILILVKLLLGHSKGMIPPFRKKNLLESAFIRTVRLLVLEILKSVGL
jgi:hypothetical protein